MSLDEPTEDVHYAPQRGTASVPFSTYSHYIQIAGKANASYCVVWHLTLRCTSSAGGHVAYVDTNRSGACPAVADGQGCWRHYADADSKLAGNLSLSAGSCVARGEGDFSAHAVGGDPDGSFGATASPASEVFAVVTEARPGGGS